MRQAQPTQESTCYGQAEPIRQGSQADPQEGNGGQAKGQEGEHRTGEEAAQGPEEDESKRRSEEARGKEGDKEGRQEVNVLICKLKPNENYTT